MLGQRRRIDLHNRSDHDQLQVRPLRRQLVEQFDIQPLVDHAVEPQPGVRDILLIFRFRHTGARLGEVSRIDAAREGVDVGDAGALGL